MMLNNSKSVLIVFALVFFLSSCFRDHKEPLLEIEPTPGPVIVGEMKEGMERQNFAIIEDEYYTTTYEAIIQPGGGLNPISFKLEDYNYNYSAQDYSSTVSTFAVQIEDPNLELLVEQGEYEGFRCNGWNNDSTVNTITTYNLSSGFSCEGSVSSLGMTTYNMTKLLFPGDTVDANAGNYLSANIAIKSLHFSRVWSNSYPDHEEYEQTRHIRGHHDVRGPAFLGFRYLLGDGSYKYGYAEIRLVGLGMVDGAYYCVYEK